MTLLKRIWAWVLSFFKRPSEENTEQKPKIKRKRKNVSRHGTLKDLLEDIEYAFNEIKVDYHRCSHLNKHDIEGLKRYGVSVIPGFNLDALAMIKDNFRCENVKDTSKLSAVVFMATNFYRDKHYNNAMVGGEEAVAPDFFYAIKKKKHPWYVARKSGVYYECAFGYVFDGKQYWASFFISIDTKTGVVYPSYYLTNEMVHIPRRSPYFRKKWQLSSWENGRHDLGERHIAAIASFYLNAWNARTKMWSTTVEKDGIRANFYVDSKDTKYYFKDRQKTFNENGQTKKIIHIVDDHDRIVSGKKTRIRAHVRGENKFMWAGYKCRVVSPAYHQFDYRHFDVAATEVPVEQEDHVSLAVMADKLHSMEDALVNKIGNSLHNIRRH